MIGSPNRSHASRGPREQGLHAVIARIGDGALIGRGRDGIFSCSVPMRHCAFGFSPASTQATSSSRDSIGVASDTSRANAQLFLPALSSSACTMPGTGADSGCLIRRPPGNRNRAGLPIPVRALHFYCMNARLSDAIFQTVGGNPRKMYSSCVARAILKMHRQDCSPMPAAAADRWWRSWRAPHRWNFSARHRIVDPGLGKGLFSTGRVHMDVRATDLGIDHRSVAGGRPAPPS